MLLTCAEFYVAFLGILMVNCKQNIAKKDAVHLFVAALNLHPHFHHC